MKLIGCFFLKLVCFGSVRDEADKKQKRKQSGNKAEKSLFTQIFFSLKT